jgi:hypothetical protein
MEFMTGNDDTVLGNIALIKKRCKFPTERA